MITSMERKHVKYSGLFSWSGRRSPEPCPGMRQTPWYSNDHLSNQNLPETTQSLERYFKHDIFSNSVKAVPGKVRKTIHWIARNHPFPIVTTHLVINMHTPPSGLVLHPAYRLTTISSLPKKCFFLCRFGRLDSLSSAHHPAYPPDTNLCVPPQTAGLCKFCLTLHTHSVPSLCQGLWSEKRDLRRWRCSFRASRFYQSARQIFQRKGTVVVNLVFSNQWWNGFRSKENAPCGADPLELDDCQKSLRRGHEFVMCSIGDEPLDEQQGI